MIKRIVPIIIALLTLLPASAQLATGSWKQYPVFGEFTSLSDTGHGVWYVTGGCLYFYDKDSDETIFYQGGKDLSDFSVKFARYNPEKKMLVVVYDDGNMDALLEDGSRVNLPEIKDAVVNIEKNINNVVFDGDEMYVAAGFGIVIYDINRLEVKESGIYNRDIANVIVTPTHLVISPAALDSDWGSELYSIDRKLSIAKFDNYRKIYRYYSVITESAPLNEGHTQFATIRNGRIGTLHMNDDGTLNSESILDRDLRISNLTVTADGVVRFITTDGRIGHYVDKNRFAFDLTMPQQYAGNYMSTITDMSEVWIADENGLGCYKIPQDGNISVLRDKSIPSGAISFCEVCNTFMSNDASKFYISNLGLTQNHPIGPGGYDQKKLSLNAISKNEITKINPTGATSNTSPGTNAINTYGPYIFSPTQIAEDPDYPERLFIGSGYEGVYVVENEEVVLKIDGSNSPMTKLGDYLWGVTGVTIDQEGNLWIGINGDPSLMVLPAAKRRNKSLSQLSANDWILPKYSVVFNQRDMKLLHCRKSNMMFGIDSQYEGGILVVDTKGTRGMISDDQSDYIYPTDQDGKKFSPIYWTCLAEDQRGHVWIGTSSGVISITNPSKALDSNFHVNRIKVPRNDGSGLADYLLESDKVVAIAVDNSNRKWLATENSGLYLVSEDGDRIISTFTTDNSPLPSNTITALYADPQSNSIFVGTLAGLYEYSSTSGPSKSDYSEVYAYPNPVTPDYSGWITIAGLMENSLVKIMDSNMQLVYQTSSEGGTAIWDGCDMRGARVRSGVYYVLASSGQEDASSYNTSSVGDVVAKILVVN